MGMVNKATIIIKIIADSTRAGIGITAMIAGKDASMDATEITAITVGARIPGEAEIMETNTGNAGIPGGIGITAMTAGSGMTFSRAAIAAIAVTNSADLHKKRNREKIIARVPDKISTGKTAAADAPVKILPDPGSGKAYVSMRL